MAHSADVQVSLTKVSSCKDKERWAEEPVSPAQTQEGSFRDQEDFDPQESERTPPKSNNRRNKDSSAPERKHRSTRDNEPRTTEGGTKSRSKRDQDVTERKLSYRKDKDAPRQKYKENHNQDSRSEDESGNLKRTQSKHKQEFKKNPQGASRNQQVFQVQDPGQRSQQVYLVPVQGVQNPQRPELDPKQGATKCKRDGCTNKSFYLYFYGDKKYVCTVCGWKHAIQGI